MALPDALPSLPPAMTWQMTWHDEFDGNSLDRTKWQVMPAMPRGGGVFNPNNIAFDGRGHLVLSGTADGGSINGAEINTDTPDKRNLFVYGYFIARVLVTEEPGVNSAFWLQTPEAYNVNSPTHGTEIDVLEYPNRDGRPNHHLHWAKLTGDVGQRANVLVNDGKFHTYAVWWTSQGYRFYVDGQMTWQTVGGGGVSSAPTHIILSLEPMKMNFAKTMYSVTSLAAKPAHYVIDYVRVYNAVPKK